MVVWAENSNLSDPVNENQVVLPGTGVKIGKNVQWWIE